MTRERSTSWEAFVCRIAAVAWLLGAVASDGAITVYPSADGTLRDRAVDGILDGLPDEVDWSFNQSSFEGAITLSTGNPLTTLEDRVVWEYNLTAVSYTPPVFATLDFTMRGAPAYPRPNVDVHIYAYDADLVEDASDYYVGFSGGPPIFVHSITVPPYQPPTEHSVSVSSIVNAALGAGGAMKAAFRFQIDPETPYALNQVFIDALDTEPDTKPVLRLYSIPGDITADGVVDLGDYAALYTCTSGPGVPVMAGCDAADLSGDHVVDMRDFQKLQGYFSNSYK
ncbi:MAG: dockerin type I domain-containing protein [Phycisphaerae bacterium]